MAQTFGEQSRIPLIGEAEILKSIINTLADGVVVADCEGRFIFFNSTAQSILGIGSIDASADRWSDIYGCYRPDRITPYPSRELPLARALAGETVPETEIFISCGGMESLAAAFCGQPGLGDKVKLRYS